MYHYLVTLFVRRGSEQLPYFKEYDPQKGELENRLANPQRQYFADGTPFSYDELNRRKLLVVKTCYKENGWKFYPTSDYDLPLQSRIKFKGDLVVCSRWRDVDTDEPYTRTYVSNNNHYYTKDIPCVRTINIAKPHHEPKYIEVNEYKTDLSGNKYNGDGTKYYP